METGTGRYGTLARVASAERASPVTAFRMLSGDERIVGLEPRYRVLAGLEPSVPKL